jgi:hypothetical protein
MATLLDDEVDPYAKYLVGPKSSVSVGSAIGYENAKPIAMPKVDLGGLNSDLKERIDMANRDWMANKELNPKGEPLPITSGFRETPKQAQLFAQRGTNPNLVAPPGYSTHEKGMGIDILPNVPDTFLSTYGLHRPYGSKDPVHVEINPNADFKPMMDSNYDEIDPYSSYLKEQGVYVPSTRQAINAQFTGLNKDLRSSDYYTSTLPKQVAALGDVVYGAVPAAVKFVGEPFAKLIDKLGDTKIATEALDKVTQFADRPIGKAFGITNDPAYNAEAANRMMDYVGKNMDKGADYIAKETGLPKSDVAWFMNAALIAATPYAARGVKKGYETGAEVVGNTKETLQNRFESLKPKNNAPIAEAPGEALKRNFEELQKRYDEERQAAIQGKPLETPLEQPIIDKTLTGSAKPTTPDAPYVEVKYAENGLPLDEQYARAQTLNRVLGPNHMADLAAIEGKGKERATNYATSNTDTQIGAFLKERFIEEQKQLANFAEKQIKNTGGTIGLDESTVYKRGNTILKPLQGLETHFDNAIGNIYKERDKLAKDIPVEAKTIANVLNDESLTLANTETIGLTNIAKARMKQLKMMDKEGNLLPTDAKTAESFRKFLNENWDRKNANLHRQLKEAVDTDVLANIDQTTPFYKEARDLVSLRKDTLDNPNGISKILDAEGPNKINRKVDIEKIAQNIADMPVDQISHVIDTLKNVPESLQTQATAALSEMKAQFANNLAAKKTPKQVTDFMNSNSEVMSRLFTPDEMNNFRDYHNAVHILATDTGYKGAAVQKINVEQKLGSKIKEQLISKGGAVAAETATGGMGMGVPALLTNEYLTSRAASKRAIAEANAEKQALENAEKRFTNIKDLIK